MNTKNFISVILMSMLFILQSCKKNKLCDGDKEIKGSNHLVDLSVLKTVPQMLDSLAKYPQLQAVRFYDDEYMTSVTCNYFYNGLKVFDASYQLTKSKKFGYFDCYDYTPKVAIPTNLVKNIDGKKALEIARKEINFKGSCLTYQLCYYYSDTSTTEKPSSYKLVWDVNALGGSAYVVLDATTGFIYHKFDGVYTAK
jgi:Zn-dependent metalloprotease